MASNLLSSAGGANTSGMSAPPTAVRSVPEEIADCLYGLINIASSRAARLSLKTFAPPHPVLVPSRRPLGGRIACG